MAEISNSGHSYLITAASHTQLNESIDVKKTYLELRKYIPLFLNHQSKTHFVAFHHVFKFLSIELLLNEFIQFFFSI